MPLRSITISALMCALSCVLYISITMLPVAGEGLNYISAIPLVYVGATLGLSESVLSVFIGGLLVFVLTGDLLWSAEYLFFIGILSISVGYGFKKQWWGNTTVVFTIACTFLGLLVFAFVAFLFLGKNNPFLSFGVSKLDRMFNYFIWAMIFLISVLSTLFVYLASVIVLTRLSIKVPPISLGKRSILQRSLFFPYLLSLALSLFFFLRCKDSLLVQINANIFLIFSLIYTFYGYKMVFEKMLIRRDKRFFYIFLMIFPPIEFGYAILRGFLDVMHIEV